MRVCVLARGRQGFNVQHLTETSSSQQRARDSWSFIVGFFNSDVCRSMTTYAADPVKVKT